MLLYALISIVVLTILFRLLQKPFPKLFCPICLASVVTWCVLLLLFLLGKNIDTTALVILMSISLGAMAERLGSRLGLVWKTLTVILGMSALYFLAQKDFSKTSVFVVSIAIVLALALIFKRSNVNKEDRFDKCCG
jgi:hypothetical protein